MELQRVKKILSLGYCFPPVPSPESWVSARILANIPDFDIHHIAANPDLLSTRRDPSLDEYIRKNIHTVDHVTTGKLATFVNKQVKSLPLRPDRWILLNRATYKKALSKNPASYSALITRSQYHSVHLVGRKLKKHFPHLPWIACFSDPWSSADHTRHVPVFSKISDYLERSVLKTADALIFPTQDLARHFAQAIPDQNILSKCHVIPHTLDKSLAPVACKPENDIILGRCLGAFYGPRRVEPLLSAIDALQTIDPEFYARLRIELIGANEETANLVRVRNLEHIVRILPAVDWTIAQQKMVESDFLIIVEAPSQSRSFYLPSKLIDYIGACRPILALSPEGTSADLIRENRGLVISPEASGSEIASVLRGIINCISNPDSASYFEAGLWGRHFSKIITDLIV